MYRILLISPYDAISHRRWRMELGDFLMTEGMEVHQVSLPARYYAWRSRGNSLTLAYDERLQHDFDLIIATSMTDLSALRGLHGRLARVPTVAYFHENQFAYPDRSETGVIERQLTSIYTALSADAVLFNSRFNRETFLKGMSGLLQKMPDGVPAGLTEIVEKRSLCLPVALRPQESGPAKLPGTIVWNHRWEHDKGLDRLLEIVRSLNATNRDYRLHLLGQQFRQTPEELTEVIGILRSSGKAGLIGFLEEERDYLACLQEAQIVLSTSRQEFQGLAVQDAISAGCAPVVPDELCYPEYVPSCYRYQTCEEAVDIVGQIMTGELVEPVNLDGYQWPLIGQGWLEIIDKLVRPRGSA